MDRVADMRAFIAELTSDHVNRSQALGELAAGVHSDLESFRADRMKMAADMGSTLSGARHERQAAIETLQQQTQAFMSDVSAGRQAMAVSMFDSLLMAHEQMSAHVASMLNANASTRKAMAEAQRDGLAAARAARQAEVADLKDATQTHMAQISASRQAMSEELSAELAADKADRNAMVAQLLADIESMLARIDLENSAAAHELRQTLAADARARSQSVASMMETMTADRQAAAAEQAANLQEFHSTLHDSVQDLLAGNSSDRVALHGSLVEMGQLWREYAAMMRGAPAVQSEPMSPPDREPAAREPEEVDDVEQSILEFLADKPEGMKLVDMEPLFGLSRPVLGRHLRALLDAGKVDKDPNTLVYKLK